MEVVEIKKQLNEILNEVMHNRFYNAQLRIVQLQIDLDEK